ncbi:MAG: ATP-binding protein [Gemmatimonadota bacterium]
MAHYDVHNGRRTEDETGETSGPTGDLVSAWESRRPAVLVVIFLVAILVIPPLVGRRISTLQTEIVEVAEGARVIETDVALYIAREAAALRGYLLTGEPEFLDSYREARVNEAAAFTELRPLAERLNPALGERVDAVRTLHRETHVSGSELLEGRLSQEEFREHLSLQQARNDLVANARGALDAALTAEVTIRRQEIQRTQRVQTILTAVLALLALGAAFLVGRLGGRLRALAVRLRRLAREEAALSRIARTLSGVRSASEVVDRVAESALEVVPARAAYVERIGREGAAVEVVAVAGSRHPELGTRVAFPGSLTNPDQPELVKVRELVERGSSIARPLETECGECSALVLPLASEGESLGALVLLREAGQPNFLAAEVARGHTLADLASMALRRALLLEERQEILAEEQRARAGAERAVRTRDSVLGIVAHDLRNPLGAVLTSSSFLLDVALPEEGRVQQLQIIHRSAERMNRLIQDLLDVARIESGGLAIDPHRIEVGPLVKEACQLHRAPAAEKGVRLELELADELPEIRADLDRLLQVFSNLLGNAIKFTDERGKVTVGAEADEEGVRFSVTDTGPGIPKKDLSKIFDAHWQAAGTAHLGSGLGLAIARGIVEAHGGRIWVESMQWVGTTFHFTLPAAAGEEGSSVALRAGEQVNDGT